VSDFTLIFGVFRRHKARTFFTVLSVAVAFAIFIVLGAVYHGFSGMMNDAPSQRLDVWGENGFPPLSYVAKIATIPGVAAVTYHTGFYGHLADPKNGVSVRAVDIPSYLKTFHEFTLDENARRQLLADRTAAVASPKKIAEMGWKLGDVIPVQGGPPQKNGSTTWTFHLVGVLHSTLPESYQQSVFVHYAYLNDGRTDLANKNTVWEIFATTRDARDITRVANAIRQAFGASQPTVVVLPDQLLAVSVVKAFGDVGAVLIFVGAAVLLALLLVAGNTMASSVQERISEYGLMRALGFSRYRVALLVLGEAGILMGCGTVLGILLGWKLCEWMAPSVYGTLPYFFVTGASIAAAAGLCVFLTLQIALPPARRVTKLAVADSLRRF